MHHYSALEAKHRIERQKKCLSCFLRLPPSDSWVIRGKLKTKGKKKAPFIIVVCCGKVIRGGIEKFVHYCRQVHLGRLGSTKNQGVWIFCCSIKSDSGRGRRKQQRGGRSV